MKNHLEKMFVAIKNGQLARKKFITVLKQKTCENVLMLMWDEGYILGYSTENSFKLRIFLKYENVGRPAINAINIISKASKRNYLTLKQVWKLNSGKTLLILSTNQGFKSARECAYTKTSGEIVAFVN